MTTHINYSEYDEHLLSACGAALALIEAANRVPVDARFIESCDSVIAGLRKLRARAENDCICTITDKIIGLIDHARTNRPESHK